VNCEFKRMWQEAHMV